MWNQIIETVDATLGEPSGASTALVGLAIVGSTKES
jgi:hypothetical protein